MEIFMDCIPCLLKQALEGSRMATSDTMVQELIINKSLDILKEYKSYETSPELARDIHQAIKDISHVKDPYIEIKEKDLNAARGVYKTLKDFYNSRDEKLYWALKISATGNNMDAAIYGNVNVEKCIKEELEKVFKVNDIDKFIDKLASAKNILIIGDNTGETIFDKVLIEALTEALTKVNITYAVRSQAIINDATMKEAMDSNLHHVSKLISTGCNAPGLIIKESSQEFLQSYYDADIIISKGQGNYEGLSEEKDIFFLLKAKCPMIAKRLKVNLNDYILKYSGGEQNEKK